MAFRGGPAKAQRRAGDESPGRTSAAEWSFSLYPRHGTRPAPPGLRSAWTEDSSDVESSRGFTLHSEGHGPDDSTTDPGGEEAASALANALVGRPWVTETDETAGPAGRPDDRDRKRRSSDDASGDVAGAGGEEPDPGESAEGAEGSPGPSLQRGKKSSPRPEVKGQKSSPRPSTDGRGEGEARQHGPTDGRGAARAVEPRALKAGAALSPGAGTDAEGRLRREQGLAESGADVHPTPDRRHAHGAPRSNPGRTRHPLGSPRTAAAGGCAAPEQGPHGTEEAAKPCTEARSHACLSPGSPSPQPSQQALAARDRPSRERRGFRSQSTAEVQGPMRRAPSEEAEGRGGRHGPREAAAQAGRHGPGSAGGEGPSQGRDPWGQSAATGATDPWGAPVEQGMSGSGPSSKRASREQRRQRLRRISEDAGAKAAAAAPSDPFLAMVQSRRRSGQSRSELRSLLSWDSSDSELLNLIVSGQAKEGSPEHHEAGPDSAEGGDSVPP